MLHSNDLVLDLLFLSMLSEPHELTPIKNLARIFSNLFNDLTPGLYHNLVIFSSLNHDVHRFPEHVLSSEEEIS